MEFVSPETFQGCSLKCADTVNQGSRLKAEMKPTANVGLARSTNRTSLTGLFAAVWFDFASFPWFKSIRSQSRDPQTIVAWCVMRILRAFFQTTGQTRHSLFAVARTGTSQSRLKAEISSNQG
jgi:hypothetical protein